MFGAPRRIGPPGRLPSAIPGMTPVTQVTQVTQVRAWRACAGGQAGRRVTAGSIGRAITGRGGKPFNSRSSNLQILTTRQKSRPTTARCDGHANCPAPIVISPPLPPVLLVKSLRLTLLSATNPEFGSTRRTGGYRRSELIHRRALRMNKINERNSGDQSRFGSTGVRAKGK